MRKITSLLVLLGITVLLYGLYNCNCKKKSIEQFETSSNVTKQTEQIKVDLNKITSLSENNKSLLDKTNQIRDNLKKILLSYK